jgi:hypothetical protein
MADAPDVSHENAEPAPDSSIPPDLIAMQSDLTTASRTGAPPATTGSALAGAGRGPAEIARDRSRTLVPTSARASEEPDSWHAVLLLTGSAARSVHWQTEPPPGVAP